MITGSPLVTGLCYVCLGITCFDLKMEKTLMMLSFHSFRAVPVEKLVKEIKKTKNNNKKGRISNDSLLFAFNILKDLLCVCMSCSN